MSMMNQPIQSRVGHHGSWEQRDPILRRPITGDDDRGFQVTFDNDLLKVFRLEGRGSGEAEVIDNQKIRRKIFFDAFLPGLISSTGQEKTEEFNRFGEEDLVALATCLMSESLGDVAFAHPGGSIEQDMFLLFDKGAVSQIANKFGIEFWVKGEVKAFDGLFFFEGGPGEPKG